MVVVVVVATLPWWISSAIWPAPTRTHAHPDTHALICPPHARATASHIQRHTTLLAHRPKHATSGAACYEAPGPTVASFAGTDSGKGTCTISDNLGSTPIPFWKDLLRSVVLPGMLRASSGEQSSDTPDPLRRHYENHDSAEHVDYTKHDSPSPSGACDHTRM